MQSPVHVAHARSARRERVLDACVCKVGCAVCVSVHANMNMCLRARSASGLWHKAQHRHASLFRELPLRCRRTTQAQTTRGGQVYAAARKCARLRSRSAPAHG